MNSLILVENRAQMWLRILSVNSAYTEDVVLVIDNYDSFTYNLVQYVGELGADVEVRRNDEIGIDQIRALAPEKILVSPGPCTPNEAGISVEVIREIGREVPLLGVCLGHQSIAAAFGADVVRARRVMHGKVSTVEHDGKGVFRDVPSPLRVTRYHSLTVAPESVPSCLDVTAFTVEPNGERMVMGVRHREYPIEGVQFHPESVLTEHGKRMIENFLRS